MDIKNIRSICFNEEALDLFKKIWLSCVIDHQVLLKCTYFLKMKSGVSLNDTFEIVKTGSATIARSLLERGFQGDVIKKEDVIRAFSDLSHERAMGEIFRLKNNDDFWHREFDEITYLFSHVLKPVLIIKKNPLVGALLWNQESSLKLVNLYSYTDIDEKKIQLVHFGAIVGELNWSSKKDKNILAQMCEEQEEIFEKINFSRVDYKNLLLFYERNFRYNNSLTK